MSYRILATHDRIGKDVEYLSDAESTTLYDEVHDSLEETYSRLQEIIQEGKVNSIEVITPDTDGSNHHDCFFVAEHPFAMVEWSFEQIDEWFKLQKELSNTMSAKWGELGNAFKQMLGF